MATSYSNIGTGSGGVGTSTIIANAVVNITGSNPGQELDIQLFNANSPGVMQVLTLASGANTINATNCPAIASAGAVWLIPPSTNTQSITLKGVTGDTGVPLNVAAPSLITLPTTPPSSFVLTAGNTIAGFRLLWL